jgi:transcription antitermination factor NusG
MTAWHVAVTGVNQEFLAQRKLEAHGFETYCPVGIRVVRHARKQLKRIFPVMSRYIFIKFDPHKDDWSPIRATDGVLDILSNNLQPVAVPHWKIAELQERELAGEFNIKPKPLPKRYSVSGKSFEILKSLLNPDQPIQV